MCGWPALGPSWKQRLWESLPRGSGLETTVAVPASSPHAAPHNRSQTRTDQKQAEFAFPHQHHAVPQALQFRTDPREKEEERVNPIII